MQGRILCLTTDPCVRTPLTALFPSHTTTTPQSNHQVAPRDVDFRIMLTFLEIYETLLRFALFKLYHGMEVAYPP